MSPPQSSLLRCNACSSQTSIEENTTNHFFVLYLVLSPQVAFLVKKSHHRDVGGKGKKLAAQKDSSSKMGGQNREYTVCTETF